MSKLYFYLSLTAALLLTSCGLTITSSSNNSSPVTKSKIVEQVEADGSGPLEQVSEKALYKWFQTRQELVLKINKQCEELRPTAPAGWGDTPEGRVCEVTKYYAVRPKPFIIDNPLLKP